MTREEAIKILSSYDVNGVWADVDGKPYNAEKQAEAFDMAIEALSAKTNEIRTETHGVCLDLISRADAEAFVCMERCGEYRKDCPAQTCPIIEHLDSIPSAEPTELLKDGTLKVNVNNGAEVNRVLVWGDDGFGGLYYADDRPNIAYFCDGAACDGECNECHHTTDIKHAKNFNIIGGKYNIKYIETDYRPSGEWVCKDSADMSVFWFECSECGEKTPRDNFNHEYKSNYCPNCGAKMGGEKHE